MKYEVVLIAQNPTRCVTTRVRATDLRDLAEQLLETYPRMDLVKARELPA